MLSSISCAAAGQRCSCGRQVLINCMPWVLHMMCTGWHRMPSCMPVLFRALPACVQVKLRKQQLQILASAEGAAAATFAKQLVTIVTDLKHPPVW